MAADSARAAVHGMISKFQPCLPEEAEDRLLIERLLDYPGTLRFLSAVKVNGARLAQRPNGTRLAEVDVTGPVPLDFVIQSTPGPMAKPRNEVQWVDTPVALRTLSEALRGADVIGLGVETDLDFGTLCLMQIATRERTYLVDPFAVGDLLPIAKVLGVAPPLKVIHNARFERRVLAAVGISIDGVFDTLQASRRARGTDSLGGHSLAIVCERELGMFLNKSLEASNWSRRPLNSDQLQYAALDAEVLLSLYDRFSNRRTGQYYE